MVKAEDTPRKSIFERKRKFIGVVVSKKNSKTFKIEIEKKIFHSLYKKRIKLSRTFLVNDEKEDANIGDKVQIIESRPLSKLKRWQLVKIIEKAK